MGLLPKERSVTESMKDEPTSTAKISEAERRRSATRVLMMDSVPPSPSSDLGAAQATQHAKDQEAHKEAAYAAWLVKRPSALEAFDRMMSTAKEKKVVVFLDYDGTLAPIVDDPNRAFMSDSMRSAVDKVAQHFPTFIISGRTRDKVYEFVKLTNVYYVGSHGMDMMAPLESLDGVDPKKRKQAIDEKGNEVVCFQPAEEFLPVIEQVYSELVMKTKGINGVMIENNKYCISVHFRRVDEKHWRILENQVINIIQGYPSLHITRGRKVIEVRPSIKWDKGRALEYLLESLGFKSDQTLPLYIGDDRTDEDAFKVLQRRRPGHPIIVSSVPKATEASYSLRDPSEVMSFLLHLFRWKRSSSSSRK